MPLFGKKLEQENFNDFEEEVYILVDGELVKLEGEKDDGNITQRDE